MNTNAHQNPVTSLASLKRRASQLAKQQSIKHCDALDRVAQESGLHNYRYAQRVLPDKSPKTPEAASYPLTLEARWRNEEVRGLESLRISLPVPWTTLLPPEKIGRYRNAHLSGWEVGDLPDTLRADERRYGQESARREAAGAARAFVFMAATGLRPLSSPRGWRRAYPSLPVLRKVNPNIDPGGDIAFPGRDHPSYWVDPQTGAYLIVNEPYMGNPLSKTDEEKLARCQQWCDAVGFVMAAPRWGGIYNPYGGTRMFLLASSDARRGVALGPVVEALERLSAPVSDTQWPGESWKSTYRYPYRVAD